MDSVLALSGVHLCHRLKDPELEAMSWKYYASVLLDLRHRLARKKEGNDTETLHLLLTALILAQVESISGNTQGAVYHHLRASRQFVLSMLVDSGTHEIRALRGFLRELYAYLVLVGTITLNAESEDRVIEFDPFMSSLKSLNDIKPCGEMFGCSHGLFELMPRVSELGKQRRLEEASGYCTSASFAFYQLLESKIRGWQVPENLEGDADWVDQLGMAATIHQHTLLIFLHTTFYGSSVESPRLRDMVDESVSVILPLWKALYATEPMSPLVTTMIWPAMIAGSCSRRPEQQGVIRSELSKSHYHMNITKRAIQLLEWLWEDQSDQAYGPFGLEVMMKKHNFNICMA
ncbi:hypothetical protein A1O3_07799 [Capronia epimyces CBS 606.96]|uniref:Transcription factor domain-containing protein n=1 Tax=Capronia epimyces CBS 606.96 TaxID=1182542 RepID=W9XQC0_9EURO|nr:uncharacterized protein A1O3_07799 [Capronia epimyces CBS 606.96]EXJ79520.1 hypothetical protein A1O3_07799 [Capronia epimyces CBS 606.96]